MAIATFELGNAFFFPSMASRLSLGRSTRCMLHVQLTNELEFIHLGEKMGRKERRQLIHRCFQVPFLGLENP